MPWVIRNIPIEDLVLIPQTYSSVDLRKAIAYSKLPEETAPPIDTRVQPDGKFGVDNGLHRTCAALIRGDKEVKISFWEN